MVSSSSCWSSSFSSSSSSYQRSLTTHSKLYCIFSMLLASIHFSPNSHSTQLFPSNHPLLTLSTTTTTTHISSYMKSESENKKIHPYKYLHTFYIHTFCSLQHLSHTQIHMYIILHPCTLCSFHSLSLPLFFFIFT